MRGSGRSRTTEMGASSSSPIHAFGLFWRSEEINWSPGKGQRGEFRLLGRQGWNAGALQMQGCLVLRYCGDFEHEIDVESGSPAGVSDVVTSRSPDQIAGEGAQARDDVGVLANAGGVLGKGGVAHVVTAILNAPMRANALVPALGRLVGSGRNPEDDLGRLGAKSRCRVALADRALQAEHGLDQVFPRRMAKPRLGRKHRQFAGFPAVAARGLAF